MMPGSVMMRAADTGLMTGMGLYAPHRITGASAVRKGAPRAEGNRPVRHVPSVAHAVQGERMYRNEHGNGRTWASNIGGRGCP